MNFPEFIASLRDQPQTSLPLLASVAVTATMRAGESTAEEAISALVSASQCISVGSETTASAATVLGISPAHVQVFHDAFRQLPVSHFRRPFIDDFSTMHIRTEAECEAVVALMTSKRFRPSEAIWALNEIVSAVAEGFGSLEFAARLLGVDVEHLEAWAARGRPSCKPFPKTTAKEIQNAQH